VPLGCGLSKTPGCDVRFGSFASVLPCPVHVRFTPDSDRIADIPKLPKSAIKRHRASALSLDASLFASHAVHNFQVAHCRLEVGRNGIIHALAAHNLSGVSYPE